MKKLLFILTTFVIANLVNAQVTRFVKPVAEGSGDGSSWTNASGDLQEIINISAPGDSIFVTGGTYKPNRRADNLTVITPSDRNNSFVLKADVKIYGGFAGTENSLADRVLWSSYSILSGDFNGNTTYSWSGASLSFTGNTEDAYHVVVSIGTVGDAILDGFAVIYGNADGIGTITVNGETFSQGQGAGMRIIGSSPTIRNCLFQANNATNHGAGMRIDNSSPLIEACNFLHNNVITGYGAGLLSITSAPVIKKCNFQQNIVNGTNGFGAGIFSNASTGTIISECSFYDNRGYIGGGIYDYSSSSPLLISKCNFYYNNTNFGAGIGTESSSPAISNCIFWNNEAQTSGGASYFGSSSLPNLTNNTFYGNYSQNGEAIYSDANSSFTVSNSIFKNSGYSIYESNTASSSIIANNIIDDISNGGTFNVTNFDADPVFVNINQPLGPDGIWGTADDGFALKACSPAINAGDITFLSGITEDIAGNSRINLGNVDIGAYEFSGTLSTSGLRFVKEGGIGDGTSWANASGDLQAIINYSCPGDTIFVSEGTYKPIRRADNIYVITPNDPNNGFLLGKDVKIYGGFAGTETLLSDRNLAANHTSILSGDLGIAGDTADNAYHVVLSINNPTAILDGFTISHGNAYGSNSINVNNISGISNNMGAGLFLYNSSPIISNCEITTNTSDYGAIYVGQGQALFTHSIFTSNKGKSVSALYNSISSFAEYEYCTFSNNTIWDLTNGNSTIFNYQTEAFFDNCTFSDNIGRLGGAMLNYAPSSYLEMTSVSNSVFSDNTADYGGAVFHQNSHSLFNDCNFSNNIANQSGGAIYVVNSTTNYPTYENTDFSNNSASEGGAVFNDASSPQFKYCYFEENKALYGGGAINSNGTGNILIENTTFIKNETSDGNQYGTGGAIQINGSTANVVNSVLVNNTADGSNDDGGGAIMLYGGTLTAANVTLYGNTTTSTVNPNSNSISITSGATLTLRNSIVYGLESQHIQNNGTANYFSSLIKGLGLTAPNLDTDPLFVDINDLDGIDNIWGTADDGLRLKPCSPAYNSGSNALIYSGNNIDITGNTRVFNTIVDMGAYETQANPGIYSSNNPQSICTGGSYTIGTHTYTTAGTYTDILQSVDGCDSTVTTSLTVVTSFSVNNPQTICQGENVTVGTSVYSTAGTYTDLLQSTGGCDSTVTTIITVNPTYIVNNPQTICSGETYVFNNHHYYSSGTYYDTLQSINGCDSVIKIILAVNQAYNVSNPQIVCSGQSYTFNGHTYTASGTYRDTLYTIHGCDSIIWTDLTILPIITANNPQSICIGGSYTIGTNTYTSPGTYKDTLQSFHGCDSIVTTVLTVGTPVLNTAVSLDNTTLTAAENNATYQWIDCDSNTPITGATAKNYTASINGNYAVILTSTQCTDVKDTSTCIEVNAVGLDVISTNTIEIFPNPAENTVYIQSETTFSSIELKDLNGKLIYQKNIHNKQTSIDISKLSAGIYVVEISGETVKHIERIIKY